MDKSNKSISLYDINILKNNIRKIMKEKHITQTELSESTGIDQPRISTVLSGKTSECFTIPQLVSISDALNVSVDTLLGVKPPEKSKQELCMSDVCSKLFSLDEIINLKIGSCRTGEYEESGDFVNETIEIERPGIYFDNQPLSDFLKEWADIKSINTSNTETKTKLLQLWKNERLSTASTQKASWHFRAKRDQAKYLANLLLQQYEEPLTLSGFDLFNDDSESILQEYIDSGNYILDFDEDDRRRIMREFEYVFEKQNEHDAHLVVPPPFEAGG